MSARTSLCLEGFPPEMKILIMCNAPDVQTLKSLAHVSSSFHQAYIKAREDIFHHLTIQTLQTFDIGLAEPWAAIKAPHLGYEVPSRIDIINEFIDNYPDEFLDERKRPKLDDCHAILNLHRTISTLIERYCETNLARNPLDTSTNSPLATASTRISPALSNSEYGRIYRAFCRWQTFTQLFGGMVWPGSGPYHWSIEGIHNEEEIATRFLGLFPIHQVEQLACLHSYVNQYYMNYANQSRAKFAISFGPNLLYRVMETPSNFEQHRKSHPSVAGSAPYPYMRDVLDAYERVVDGGDWPWRGTDKASNREEVPIGWKWASARGPQNVDLKLRRWGYVFWDHQRLDDWGVTEETMLNWPWRQST